MNSGEIVLNMGQIIMLVFVGVAIGYFGSLLAKALSKDEEMPKSALCLSREKEDGRLKVYWDGQAVNMASMLTFEQRNLVQLLAVDLNTWLGNPIVAPATPPPAVAAAEPLPFALPSPILFSASGTTSPSSSASAPTGVTMPPVPVLRHDPEPEKPLKFSMNPADMVQTVRENWDKPKSKGMATRSIIAEVDAILQDKVIGTPFDKRGIRLLEKPDHTMLIEIGLNKYDGIEAIPSEDIRELIRSCVNEWTYRSARGS